ncbi:MAG: archaellum operon transcriptional activator EarA family protein [Thermoplasmatota archaeon]
MPRVVPAAIALARTRIGRLTLLRVALHGPASCAEIARSLGTRSRHVEGAVFGREAAYRREHSLEALGLVRVERDVRVIRKHRVIVATARGLREVRRLRKVSRRDAEIARRELDAEDDGVKRRT